MTKSTTHGVRRLLAMLLVLVMTLALLPAGALAADGTTGDVSWSYDDTTATLTISGEGAMPDYKSSGTSRAPWIRQSFCNVVKTVVVEDGVTSVGNYAFYGMLGLKTVTIADSVTKIGSYAFRNCSALESVKLPAKQPTIGSRIFDKCTKLNNVVIPDGWTSIPNYTFSGCSGLSNITLPDTLKSFGYYALYSTAITEISIPESVTEIYAGAFSDCASLTSVKLPSVMPEEFGVSVFSGCTALTSVVIPDGWTSLPGSTFDGCTALESVTVPDTVTSFGYYVFNGCSKLTGPALREGVTYGERAYSGTAITSAAIPASMTEIPEGLFENCTALESVTMHDGVTAVGEYAFSGCTALTGITLPASVTSIGSNAFDGASAMKTIALPKTVKTIGSDVFANWGEGQTVEVPFRSLADFVDFVTVDPAVFPGENFAGEVKYTDTSARDVSWCDFDAATITTEDVSLSLTGVDVAARTAYVIVPTGASFELTDASVSFTKNGEAWTAGSLVGTDVTLPGYIKVKNASGDTVALYVSVKNNGFLTGTSSFNSYTRFTAEEFLAAEDGRIEIHYDARTTVKNKSAKIALATGAVLSSVSEGTIGTPDENNAVEVTGIDFSNPAGFTFTVTNGMGGQRSFTVRIHYKWLINVSKSDNGTAEANVDYSSGAEGATITMYADPNEGMVVDGWSATYVDEFTRETRPLEITASAESSAVATFVMPAGAVTVTPSFRARQAGEKSQNAHVLAVSACGSAGAVDKYYNTRFSIILPKDSDLTAITPVFTVSEGASVTPAGAQDFSSGAVTYTVTAEDGVTSKTYTLTIAEGSFYGNGTETDPYQIRDAAELTQLGKNVNGGETYAGKYFLQTADIDMTGITSWDPIGRIARSSIQYKFDATYDGGGHSIKNFTVDRTKLSDGRYFGLFGNVTVLKNLTLDESCSITLRSWSGTLVYNVTQMENCFSYATVTAQTTSGDNNNASIGGLAKIAVKMKDCANYGSVTVNGGGTVGGLAVDCYHAVNCYNYGAVSATGAKVGGLFPALDAFGNTDEDERGVASGCGNYGAVTGGTSVGGLVGENSGILEDCYNVGDVKATKDGAVVGGLVGIMYNTSYYTTKVGVFNSYHAGSVAYNPGDDSTLAGHLIGKTLGSGNTADCLGGLYYQKIGVLPAVGNYDASSCSAAMELADMKSVGFVDTLNNYKNISLSGAEWASDTEGRNNGLPVVASTEVLKNYENKLLTLTLNGQNAIAGENHTFTLTTLPYGTDLTQVTMTAKVSARAAISPASGSALDFSGGPVTVTVTAEDGTAQSYTVTATAAATASGLTALRISSNNDSIEDLYTKDYYRGQMLLDSADFKPEQTDYSVRRYDAQVQGSALSANRDMFIWAVPADLNATVTAAFGAKSSKIPVCMDMMADCVYASKVNYWDDTNRTSLLTYGQNTMTLTVTPPENGAGTEVTYTIAIEMVPSLKNVTFAESVTQDQTFAYDVLEYTLTVPDNVTSLTPTVTYSANDFLTNVNSNGKIEYQPALDESGKLNLEGIDSFKIILTGGEGDKARETVYTFHLGKSSTYPMQAASNVENLQLRVYDESKAQVTPENGVYSLEEGKTYTYVAVAKGYKSQTGTVAGASDLTDGKLTLTLEPVAPSTLTQLPASWPSFRGNDSHMAVTSAETARSADEAELLWGVAAGVGFDSGAVSSPIIVNGYLYAYAGTELLKISRDNGTVAASGSMVGASNFAIVPPTYANGMIFVGLSNGRVQAFNADTLESLWVYTDPLGGQPNSPITYHDGCVYTGFWNGETRNANFVCLAVDDEDTANTTEAKQALWTYTQTGGFYWAGAYAHGNYVVVGTDDGNNGYTSSTANLLVLNKDNGAVVSSKSGYTGDIRSNISYDADSGRVYFTSKGGYFYSEKIDWTTGAIDTTASKAVNLGGMSTSTPVVYKGRAYVGVAGTGQFTPYSGHHIAVLDLTSWSVAYTATTQGYPQTSGMLTTAYEKDEGYVYVYFMDNYTPGVMRVIKDSAGQTQLLDGVTEDGHENCAPVVFTPTGDLAQYCICSPVVDANGVIYFKNDSGNMMAIGRKQTATPITVTFDAQGGTAGAETMETKDGLLAELPTAEKDDYTFLGWFTEAEGGESVTTETVFTRNTTVYAHWELKTGYRVSVGEGSSINVGESAGVEITVANTQETVYNAYHLIVTYDAEKLTYTAINTDATVKDENGTLTVSGYGADKTCGTDNLVLTFTGKAPGEAAVTVTAAYIDKSLNAITQDAPPAAIDAAETLITVGGYTVTLDENFTGESSVAPGTDYTFTAKDTHYDYDFSDSTMGGGDVTVTDNGDGTFTVKNVTGNLIITAEKTAKTYAVTVDGSGAADVTAADKATYGTDYTFSVTENAAYTYTVSAKVGGAAAALTNNGDGTYTIAGASVTGEVTITVTKTAKPVTTTTVVFTGSGSADVEGGTTRIAPNGQDFLFALNKEEGYDYTVKLGEDELTAGTDGKYTIPGAKLAGGTLTVTVEKTAQQTLTVEVSEYVKLDGKIMWLVTATGTVSENKTLAYAGTPMFWSEKYDAYAFLVISEKEEAELRTEAAANIAESSAAKTEIAYDFDVNESKLVDINDAQLVYDMYNARYDSFVQVSMLRFLKADCNGDKILSVNDPVAIVNHLRNG